MRSVLASAMVITMALSLLAGVIFLGGVGPDFAAPMFGLAFLAGAVWAAQLLFTSEATWKRSPMNWPVLAFLGYAIIRYFTSPFEYDARVELFQIGLCALAYFIAANQFRRPLDRQVLLTVLMLLAVFESGYAVWQLAARSDAVLVWTRTEGYRGRGSGSYICPNNLAALLEMALGLIVARAALVHVRDASLERFVLKKLLIIYAAFMAAGGILITFSRTGWIAASAGLIALLVWGDWRPRFSWPRVAVVIVVLGLMGLAAWKFAPVHNYLVQSFTVKKADASKTVGLKDPTLGTRVYMWKGTLKMFAEHPLFGNGMASWQWFFGKYRQGIGTHTEQTHNEYLNLASDYGLVGFLLVGAFFVGFYRHAFLLSAHGLPSEQRAFAVGSAIAVSMVLVHSLSDFPFHIPANALLLSLITGCVAAMNEDSGRFAPTVLKWPARYTLGAALLLGCVAGAWFYGRTALAAQYTALGKEARVQFIADKGVALSYFNRAIALDPKSPEPHANIGDIYRTQALWRLGPEKQEERKELAGQAIQAYQRAMRLNSYDADVLVRLGKACELAGQDEEALKNYLRAAEVDPYNGFVHGVLGHYYRDHGDPNRAREEFKKAWECSYGIGYEALWNLEELGPP